MSENAGNNSQNHQVAPIPVLESAIAINKNAIPINTFLNAWSKVSTLRPVAHMPSATSSVAGFAISPVNACGIRLMFAPQPRQKLPPSGFGVAHLGQNIY